MQANYVCRTGMEEGAKLCIKESDTEPGVYCLDLCATMEVIMVRVTVVDSTR